MTWLSNVWMSGRRKSLTTKRSLDFRWRHVLEPTLISCTEFSSGPSRCSPSRRACGLGGRVKRRSQLYLFLRLFRYGGEGGIPTHACYVSLPSVAIGKQQFLKDLQDYEK